MRPQPAGVVVTAVEGDPSERPVLHRAGPPLRHQSGLAETCWSADENELRRGPGQVAREFGALHPLLTQAWGMELGLHRHVGTHAGRWNRYPPQYAVVPLSWVVHLAILRLFARPDQALAPVT